MQLHTPVEAQDDECDVNSQAHTRIEAELLVECVPMEYAVGRHLVAVAVQIPHITQIEERSTVEHTPYREAELKVCLQSHISHLHGVGGVLCWCVARSQCTRSPASHTVTTSDVEHSVEWQCCGVAVRYTHAGKYSTRQSSALAERNLAADA